ncbi:ATP-binding cassette domain-containing protein [Streptomyces albulus]|nr:ATP-binding cassette domain-containing protein [Streptomyces noursei]
MARPAPRVDPRPARRPGTAPPPAAPTAPVSRSCACADSPPTTATAPAAPRAAHPRTGPAPRNRTGPHRPLRKRQDHLARCLAGLHRDHDGEILLDGTRCRAASATAAEPNWRPCSTSSKTPGPRSTTTVPSSTRSPAPRSACAAPTPRRPARGSDHLTRLGLPPDSAHRLPARLSGGELHRAALARALLARPRILVCDEVTSGLDTVSRRSLLDLLSGLVRDRGEMSLVLITHDLDTARLAHHIAVLDAGELAEHGPAERILTAPRHPFTVSLLRTVAVPDVAR